MEPSAANGDDVCCARVSSPQARARVVHPAVPAAARVCICPRLKRWPRVAARGVLTSVLWLLHRPGCYTALAATPSRLCTSSGLSQSRGRAACLSSPSAVSLSSRALLCTAMHPFACVCTFISHHACAMHAAFERGTIHGHAAAAGGSNAATRIVPPLIRTTQVMHA